MKRHITDIVYGFVALVFSLYCYAYLIPKHIRVRAVYMADASAFPRLAALVIGCAGLLLIVSRLWMLTDKRALLDKANYAVNGKSVLRQAIFIAAMVAYLELIPVLGFVIASSVFTFAMLYYFGARALATNAAVSVVYSAAVYALFSRVFQISLATGPLPF